MKLTPPFEITPLTAPSSIIRSETLSLYKSKCFWFSTIFLIAFLYKDLSHWTLVAQTAGPFEALRSLKWIPAKSAAMPIAPPKASISFTKCPLPTPPIEGLQDIWPKVSIF